MTQILQEKSIVGKKKHKHNTLNNLFGAFPYQVKLRSNLVHEWIQQTNHNNDMSLSAPHDSISIKWQHSM